MDSVEIMPMAASVVVRAAVVPNASSARTLLVRFWPVLSLLILLGAGTWLSTLIGDVAVQRTVIEALIKVVTVVGLYLFVGNSGVVSLGHVAFMAIAAYASAWQTCCEALKPITMSGLPAFLRDRTYDALPAGVAAVLLAGVAALLVGLVLMRLSGLAVSIATLAALFILKDVYSNWETVTMGTASIVGLPTYVTPWIALACAALAIVVAYLYQISSWGLALRATREDEVAAAASGIAIYWQRVIAFSLSGLLMGVAGVLHAHYLGTVSVDTFFLGLTFLTLAMLVVGGMRSLAGAVVGVIVISAIADVFRRFEAGVTIAGTPWALPAGTQELVLAAMMLLILIFRRDGLMGGRELKCPAFLWRKSATQQTSQLS